MGLLFENPNAKSLDKKWCATSMLPIYTPLQVLPLRHHIQKSYQWVVSPLVRSNGDKKRREYRLVRPKFG